MKEIEVKLDVSGKPLDWDSIMTLDELKQEIVNPRLEAAKAYAHKFERDAMETALCFGCRAVYVVDWTEQHESRLDFCYMCYPFQARREAFKLAKEKHTTVKIFNFRRWIDMPEDEFQCAFYPSPNKDIAVLIRERHRGHRLPPFRTM